MFAEKYTFPCFTNSVSPCSLTENRFFIRTMTMTLAGCISFFDLLSVCQTAKRMAFPLTLIFLYFENQQLSEAA